MHEQIQKVMNEVGFQQLDKTSEYMETHYYKQPNSGNKKAIYTSNRLVIDYLQHLVKESKGPFLSSTFIDISMRYLPFALSILDLPFE